MDPTAPTVSPDPKRPTPGEWDPVSVVRHLAHELRQPLSAMEAIAFYLGMVLPPGDSKAREYVRKMQLLIEQTGDILSDATSLIQPESPQREPHDLNELVSSYLADTACREQAEVDARLADGLPLVSVDPAQIRQLLDNMLRLARRSVSRNQSVRLRTQACGTEVRVELDALLGDGSAHELECLFRSPELHAGSGSGLAAAGILRTAQAHEGAFEATAAGPGRIYFTLSLPGAASAGSAGKFEDPAW